LREQPADYVSLLAACDAVVTKPGYGIVADCLANQVPILYTERGPFREYDVLVEAVHRLGCAHYVPRPDVLSGRLTPHLDALFDSACAWSDLPLDGARVVAQRVCGVRDRQCGVM
jgi:L-arabinokinase